MCKFLVLLQSLLLIIATSLFALAADRLGTDAETKFCSVLENKPVFSTISQFATKHSITVEDLFLEASC